jgi:hypothetical protein
MLAPPPQKYFVPGPGHHGPRQPTVLPGTSKNRTTRQWLYRGTRRLPHSAGLQTWRNKSGRQLVTMT